LSGSIVGVTNTYTGEECLLGTFCPFRIGIGFGAAASAEVGINWVGPWCGKDFEGTSCHVEFDAVEGVGISAQMSLCGGFGTGVDIGPSVGSELSLTFNYCATWVISCKDTPCECK
jgi:hypothetical protein